MTLPQRCETATATATDAAHPQSTAAIPTRKAGNWQQQLQRLAPLALPLLPCGAGKEKKGPIDPATGYGLKGWEAAAFTVPEILAMNGVVRSVGSRTGAGLLAIDIDGGTALELCLEHGCDPQQAQTWQVHRDTDPLRLKLLWRLTPEQQQQLGQASKKAITKLPDRDEAGQPVNKGEAVEVFHHEGRQVLLLGQHVPSLGIYIWPEGCGPEALAPIPPAWWELVQAIAAGQLGIRPQASSSSTKRTASSRDWESLDPCPICGRDTTAYCSRHKDSRTIRCFHGSTFNPEIRLGLLKVGQTVDGTDGIRYAFTGAAPQANGDTFSTFVVHKERTQSGMAEAAHPRVPEANQQQGAPVAGQHQQRKAVPVDQVRQQLAEALADGIGAADLAALVAELAEASGIAAPTIQRIADGLQRDRGQEAAVAAEALQLAAEADRQEIGQVLTPFFLLPGAVAHAIEVRTRYLPCEGPSAVLPFLAAVAGLVKLGTRVEGCAAAGFRVPVNLFGCLVGRSGVKKSPVHALLVDEPTHALRAELAASHAHDMDDWREACQAIKKGEPKPEPPAQKRLKVGDFTGEALAGQLQTQEQAGLGLLVHRDELSGLFGSLNQYRGGRGADEQQLLELFDGGGLTSLRVSGDRTYSRSQLSIFGGTQPEILRELVGNGDASGLWARFMFVPLPERAIPLPMVTDPTEVAEVESAALTLADACRAVYRMAPHTYRLSPAAAERFATYELSRQRAAQSAAVGAQSAVYGKSAGKVLRVAGLLHLLQIACHEADSGALIEADTINRAIALVDHLDAWALSLHAEIAAGGVGQTMRVVHRMAEAAGQPIRWKEFAMRASAKQRKDMDAGAFRAAAHALAEAGYGEIQAGSRGAVSYRATKPLP